MSPRARYDEHGNIILPGADGAGVVPREAQAPEEIVTDEMETEEEYTEPLSEPSTIEPEQLWEETVEPRVRFREKAWEGMEAMRDQAREMRNRMHLVAASAILEGVQQYGTSARDVSSAARSVHFTLREGLDGFWAFLRQPVWVPGRREPKKYSRGTLFVIDVLRFGGTFAMLFGILFVGMNYESFWKILQSRLDPLGQTELVQNLRHEVDDALQSTLHAPTIAAKEGDLLSHLPFVGPPVNRLIIPKLGLNVPIVAPPNTNLLKQDWTALEEDIQTALQDGVVHYPGTAVAGQAGNFFITGHSSFYPFMQGGYKTVFARLHELNVGDEYWVYFRGDKHRYVVQTKDEVKPSDVKVLDQPLDQRLSTLMTCTPVGTTLRRLVIVAQEVDPSTGIAMHVGEHAVTVATPQVQVESLPI